MAVLRIDPSSAAERRAIALRPTHTRHVPARAYASHQVIIDTGTRKVMQGNTDLGVTAGNEHWSVDLSDLWLPEMRMFRADG